MTKMYLFAGAMVAVSMGMPATPAMAQAKKPNIVIIWGDDIGQSNISAYSHGVMGYKTPNIDRVAKEGMMFTDYYAEQSCTAGRASFITGQSGLRTGLTKVGLPGATGGAAEGRPDDRRAAEAARLRDRAVRQEPSRRPQRVPAHGARLRRVLRQPLPPERRGRAGAAGLPERPGVPRQVRPARRAGLQGLGHGRRHGRPALRQGRQAGLQGHRSADQEADGNDRRRHRRPRRGLHQAAERGRQAGLRLGELHPHALPHPHQAGEPRPVGALAEPVPRRHDRPRQERRHGPQGARRPRHRGQHLRHVLDRQRPAHEQLARRGDDAVPQREEHELGRRLPRAGDGPLAGQDQAGHGVERDRRATTTGCRPSWRWRATRT